MIKAVIFDFFGVLVTEGFKQFRETYFADDEERDKSALKLVKQVDSGLIPTNEFSQKLAALAGVRVDVVRQELGNNRPNEPLLNYIRDSLSENYVLGILSNSSQNYPAELLRETDLNLFDNILLSYRHGIVKPQPEIYEIAASGLGVSPKGCVFVDDSPTHCEGARRVGMQAILYTDFPELKKDLGLLLAAGPNN